jgi:thiosulfate dehydrogenase (quinone) large subunit
MISQAVTERAPLWPIAICRMLIGILWLFSLRWKLPPDFAPDQGRGLMDWLQLAVQHPASQQYAELVRTVVIPNFTVFAWLVFLAELFVGLALLTGTLTRAAGLLGLAMSLNLLIAMLEVPGEWPWSYLMMAMWHALFVVTGAGRALGVDGWLRRRQFTQSRWMRMT